MLSIGLNFYNEKDEFNLTLLGPILYNMEPISFTNNETHNRPKKQSGVAV